MIEYNEMTSIDRNLVLLKGGSIYYSGLLIEPYTLGEIVEYGYTAYMQDVRSLMLTFEDLSKGLDEFQLRILKEQNITAFDYYVGIGGQGFKDLLLKGLKLVFKTNNVIIQGKKVIIDSDFDSVELQIVTSENFDTLIDIVKTMNKITDTVEESDEENNPVDDETRELMQRMKAYRDKVSKIKQENMNEDDEGLTFDTLISAITVMSHSINKFNVWDLTLFQAYDEYARLQAIQNYDISVKSAMTGMVKDVKIESWAQRI